MRICGVPCKYLSNAETYMNGLYKKNIHRNKIGVCWIFVSNNNLSLIKYVFVEPCCCFPKQVKTSYDMHVLCLLVQYDAKQSNI